VTKDEREKIREAIHLIHHVNDYHGGMDILAKLAGVPVRHLEIRPTTIAEIVKRGPSVFKAHPEGS